MSDEDRVEIPQERPDGSMHTSASWRLDRAALQQIIQGATEAAVRATSEHAPPRSRTGHRERTIAYTLGGTPTRLWITLIVGAATLFAAGYTWVRTETDAARQEARTQCAAECDFSKSLLVECLDSTVEPSAEDL